MTSGPSNRQKKRRKTPPRWMQRGGVIFDALTVLFITASMLMLVATVLIINNPESALNPFPATPLPTFYQSPTPSATFTPSVTPTATPTDIPPTFTPTNTPTLIPSLTPSLTLTPTPVLPGLDGLPTIEPGQRDTVENGTVVFQDPNAEFPFVVFAVRYEQNSRSSGCNWISIAGNISGRNGEPITDIAVEVTGDDFEFIRFSGADADFGIAGFEIQLGTQPFSGSYNIRLLGTDGLPLSDTVEIEIGNTCQTNVTIVEFRQVRDF